MPFFTKRRKDREEAAARARGEPVDYLTESAPQEFRMQLWFAIDRASSFGSSLSLMGDDGRYAFFAQLHRFLCEEYGRGNLAKQSTFSEDLRKFVIAEASTHELMDVIDTVILELRKASLDQYTHRVALQSLTDFVATVKGRMREHKLAYDIVEGQVVEKNSEELHQAVIVPALTLLHDRPRFTEAEKQFRDALNELADGNWADAVTDANATVENLLRKLTGFSQGQLSDLLAEVRKKGLFGDPQEARIKKVLSGLSALVDIRNKESDAHGNVADEATAWLAVHWAGALLVYLVQRAEAVGI